MEKREVTLSDIVRIFVKHWYIILAAMVIGALGALYCHTVMLRPQYASKTVYYVKANKSEEKSDLLEQQRVVSFSRMIVGNHIDLLDTYDYCEALSEQLDALGGDADSDLGRRLSAYFEKETGDGSVSLSRRYSFETLYRVISYHYDEENTENQTYYVTVTTGNARDSYIIAKVIEATASSYASSMDETLAGTLVISDRARLNTARVNDRRAVFALLGLMIGFVLSFGILFLVDINDVRVKDERDLTKAFDMPVLGTIPEYSKTGTGVHAKA